MSLENAKNEFMKFVNNYNLDNPNMARKVGHSIRVMEISKKIAENLNLEKEQINLAMLIGLLHDIARFEQLEKYGTFKDSISVDHGDLGVEILKANEYIRKYIDTDKYDNIIFKAVKNHNKYRVEEGLTEEELLYAKIVRDADKVDILYEGVTLFWENEDDKDQIENSTVGKEVLDEFKSKSLVDKDKKETLLDDVIGNIAFIFDLNFEYSLKILQKEDYINKILNKFEFKNEDAKKQIEEVRLIADKYMKEKITG